MSGFLEEKSAMPPQISPKDIPAVEENSDSEEEEPVPPLLLENAASSDDDADNMADESEENDMNVGYVELSQDEGDSEQATNQWPSQEQQDSLHDNELESGIAASDPASKSINSEDEMKPEQVDLIRQVMAGITLPSSSIPDWAKVIPEERWKASLVSSISNRTAPLDDSGNTD